MARLAWAHLSRGLALKLVRRKRRLEARHAPPPPAPVYPRAQASASGLWVIGVVLFGAVHAMHKGVGEPLAPPRLPSPVFSVPVTHLPSANTSPMDRIRAELNAVSSTQRGWVMPPAPLPDAPRAARKAAKPVARPHVDASGSGAASKRYP